VTDPGRVVFLSYASQDAQPAQKICEALRAAGIEVFLDQSELRGGDAWDQKIRREIHECALFLPLISAHSDARHEGYFRREWKLAVDRTADMSDRVAFLVPVVIDDTSDSRARMYRSAFDRCSGRACREARQLRRASRPTRSWIPCAESRASRQ
jgi:TIR domain-containing protein